MKVINKWNSTCMHCNEPSKSMTMCDDGSCLGVCNRCGIVTFDQQVDILEFMENLVRMNVTSEVDLIEQVKVELAESMSWLDAEFIDSFAGLLVRQFRDQAIFNVETEQNEKSKYQNLRGQND